MNLSLWIEIEDPRVKNRGSKVKTKVNWEGCLNVKEDITAISALPVEWPRSLRSVHVREPPDLGTGNHGDFCGDHGCLSVGTRLGWWCAVVMQASLLSLLYTCLNGVKVKESHPLRTVLSQAPRVLFLCFRPLDNDGHLCWRWCNQLRWHLLSPLYI